MKKKNKLLDVHFAAHFVLDRRGIHDFERGEMREMKIDGNDHKIGIAHALSLTGKLGHADIPNKQIRRFFCL